VPELTAAEVLRRWDLLVQATNLRLRAVADLRRADEAHVAGDAAGAAGYLARARQLLVTCERLQEEATAGLPSGAD
jgi:hypothetical protein